MAYSINVKVAQSDAEGWFSLVEKTVWYTGDGGTWSECDGVHTLSIGGGTSGMLRFRNKYGEFFLVALGVHNNERWCDIVPDQAANNTCMEIHPQYYSEDNAQRNEMLWKQSANEERTCSNGRNLSVNFYKKERNTFYATITIS